MSIMHRCSVDSNCRGLGIGKKLVEALEKKAKENGYDTVYLDVVRTNTNSLTLSTTSAIASNDVRVLVSKVG